MTPTSVAKPSHDLAAVVDPVGSGETKSPRNIDGGEAATRIQEARSYVARPSTTQGEPSHDLATVVDPWATVPTSPNPG
jgi:hypothetical protein